MLKLKFGIVVGGFDNPKLAGHLLLSSPRGESDIVLEFRVLGNLISDLLHLIYHNFSVVEFSHFLLIKVAFLALLDQVRIDDAPLDATPKEFCIPLLVLWSLMMDYVDSRRWVCRTHLIETHSLILIILTKINKFEVVI